MRRLLCVLLFLCFLLLFMFSGCGSVKLSNNTDPTDVSAIQDSVYEKDKINSEVDNTVALTGNIMEPLKRPNKITVISQFESDMGRKAKELNKNQIDDLVKKINSLQLKEYDFEKSVIDIPDGGGILVECFFDNGKIIFNFVSSEIITVKESNKNLKWFKDESNNYKELEQRIIGFLQQ